jgi:hypothetical protein
MDGHMDQDIVKRILRETREFWERERRVNLGLEPNIGGAPNGGGRAKHGGIREVEN